jgi:nucleoside-diphosphate-sugar epimerase
MATVFVTGATGYIGAVVCEKLRGAGHETVGLARSDESARKLAAAGVRPHRGDLADAASLASACRAADGVIHTAAEWGPHFGERDRAAVVAMLDALAGTDKPFVYTSGTWVMGSTGGRLAGEMFPLNPPAAVAWRTAVERMVLDAVERKVCGVVVRPAMVHGRGGGTAGRLARREIPVAGSGEQHWSFVHVDDLADLLVLAAENAAAGSLYVAADGPPVKAKDLAAACGVTTFLPIERARERFGPTADCMVLDQRIGSTRAGRELGWKPSRPTVLDGIRRD